MMPDRKCVTVNRRGVSVMEIMIALGLMAVLFVPIFQVYLGSVRFTQYSGEKITANSFALSLITTIQSGETSELLDNEDLSSQYQVTQNSATTYRIEPKVTDGSLFALATTKKATTSSYHIPKVNIDLTQESLLFSQTLDFYLVSLAVYQEAELIGIYQASEMH